MKLGIFGCLDVELVRVQKLYGMRARFSAQIVRNSSSLISLFFEFREIQGIVVWPKIRFLRPILRVLSAIPKTVKELAIGTVPIAKPA